LTAKDAYGNTATGYTGTVAFSGGGTSPALPGNYSFLPGDNGTHTFSATQIGRATCRDRANNSVIATITGNSSTIADNHAGATTFTVTGPAAATADTCAHPITVTAMDAYGNTATGYTGTVGFTGGGTSPALPGNYSFLAGDNGTHTFSAT